MKRTIIAALSTAFLLLSGCTGGEPDVSTDSTPTTITEQANDGPETITLGEPFTWNQCGDDASCDIEVLFTKATLTETCPHGVSYSDMETMGEPGIQYLTLEGEYHVRANERQSNFSIAETDFTAVDEDGNTSNSLVAYGCESHSIDDDLSNPVDVGLKRQGELTLAVPEGTRELRYRPHWSPTIYVLDISDFPVETGSRERPQPSSPETSNSTVPVQQRTPQSNESADSIWNEPGVGFQCAGTDAWVDDPSHCTSENLGGDPSYDTMWGPDAAIPAEEAMRDPSTIPYSEGGTCPPYRCGYGTDAAGNDLNVVREEAHRWWSDCVAVNTAEHCRASDPYR
ncbi:hypothetical protein [Corynebacterium antarcticum]|uniref:hypothetical protein n=1 Tax=Corynebacterium antarcticum TaxID=2800405 RepID=UPI002260DE33|nr:hypothetical protein [Corynebacterium antarcticum]MCX7540528.1 hypothetical protein [Corynebacterium antarcticum]